MALNCLLCADVPLRNYSLAHCIHRVLFVQSVSLYSAKLLKLVKSPMHVDVQLVDLKSVLKLVRDEALVRQRVPDSQIVIVPFIYLLFKFYLLSLRCFDVVGWETGSASGP